MDPSEFRIVLDDRPLHETAVAAWCEAADIDVVWWCSDRPADPEGFHGMLPAPLIAMSAIDVAAASREAPAEGLRVLIVADALPLLMQAIRLGLPPMRLVVAGYASASGARRLSSEVSLDEADHLSLAGLFAQGFEVILQTRPNVTPRPLPMPDAG